MTPQAIQQLQASLGVPQTGVLDAATSTAMNTAIATSLSKNPTVQQYGGNTSPTAILNAFNSGDWSGVTSLSGTPFTADQQQAAVRSAQNALGPAYNAQQENDTAATTDTLQGVQDTFGDTENTNNTQFGKDKNAADESAATNGVLFSGSRVQNNNNLATLYAQKDAAARRQATEDATTAARNYAYQYGAPAAGDLSSLYSLPGANSYNANVAGGKVTTSPTLSAVYNPETTGYQGTKVAAQSAAVQTRAATTLANTANKLSLGSYANKF